MKDTYWKQFMASGKIEDYLSYKNSGADDGTDEAQSGQSGKERQLHGSGDREEGESGLICGRKESRESDHTDRHGAIYHAGGRI